MKRDFTYIDDIIDGLLKVCFFEDIELKSIYNIGCSNPVEILEFIKLLENQIGIKAQVNYKPIQKGEALSTFADITLIESDLGFKPKIAIEEGVNKFISWFKEYYNYK
jgi:UDP-glucuronate 4-epimerase